MASDLNHADEKPMPLAAGSSDEEHQQQQQQRHDDDNNNEPGSSSTVSPERKPVDFDGDDQHFDRGFKAWSQVIGSFFLFFNSWYVSFRTTEWISLSLFWITADGCP